MGLPILMDPPCCFLGNSPYCYLVSESLVLGQLHLLYLQGQLRMLFREDVNLDVFANGLMPTYFSCFFKCITKTFPK